MRQSSVFFKLFLVFLLISISEITQAKEAVNVSSLDGRKATFYLYAQQRIKELKPLISRFWDIPVCNMRLTVGKEDDVLTDDTRIESLGRHEVIRVHDIGHPLGRGRFQCQQYDRTTES